MGVACLASLPFHRNGPPREKEVKPMIWILLIAGLALVILAGFALLVAGVHSTDRHMRLRDTSDTSTTRGFARRVLGVYVRQPEAPAPRDEVRR
jgi:hypothetical protein